MGHNTRETDDVPTYVVVGQAATALLPFDLATRLPYIQYQYNPAAVPCHLGPPS